MAAFVGQTLIGSVEFTDPKNQPYDPDYVQVEIKPPAGASLVLIYAKDGDPDKDIIRDSEGNYHVLRVAGIAGTWTFGWTGRGPREVYDAASEPVLARPTQK
jgi:hypothetical protein